MRRAALAAALLLCAAPIAGAQELELLRGTVAGPPGSGVRAWRAVRLASPRPAPRGGR